MFEAARRGMDGWDDALAIGCHSVAAAVGLWRDWIGARRVDIGRQPGMTWEESWADGQSSVGQRCLNWLVVRSAWLGLAWRAPGS